MDKHTAPIVSELEYLQALVDTSVDLQSVVGLDYRYRFANQTFLKFWARSPEQVVGQRVGDILGEARFRDLVKPLLDRAFAGESVSYAAIFDYPLAGTRKCYVHYSLARSRDGSIFGVAVVVKDITDLEQVKEALSSSQDLNRVTFDYAAVGIAHVSLQGSWLEVNSRLCEIVGYSREQLILLTFQDITHPDDLETDMEHVRSLLAGEKLTYSMEKRYLRASGEVIWIELTVSLVRDAQGNPLHFVSFVQDIHARKMAELNLVASRQALAGTVRELGDKAVALERFVHVLSHDLREPLNTIANFAGLLDGEASIAPGTGGRKYLGYVQSGAGRMKSLLDDLAQYVRLDRAERHFSVFSLTPVAEAVISDLSAQIGIAGAVVTIDPLPDVTGEPNLIRLVLQNLVSNAIKFVEPDTVPVIRIRDDTVPGAAFRISVCDNGIGIDAAGLPALFSPFSRLQLRRRYAGSGLGLAICKRIAELHGGRVEVASAPGAGSRFTLELPRQPDAGENA